MVERSGSRLGQAVQSVSPAQGEQLRPSISHLPAPGRQGLLVS